MGNKGVKGQETKRVREVIAEHDLTLLFQIVDRRSIEAALRDAYRRGVEDGVVKSVEAFELVLLTLVP